MLVGTQVWWFFVCFEASKKDISSAFRVLLNYKSAGGSRAIVLGLSVLLVLGTMFGSTTFFQAVVFDQIAMSPDPMTIQVLSTSLLDDDFYSTDLMPRLVLRQILKRADCED
ncbi:hypothetical protein EDD86DRAFT_248548 [Gorgonomyces haynaldii]|nr:hypothetical protein EDD86DRAFT_248548 [Gorgonomyces haynaldii]